MAEDLRMKLGKASIEPQEDGRVSGMAMKFALLAKAYQKGEEIVKPPTPRFPVIIGEDGSGPLDSPEKLQELLGLPSVPEVSTTKLTGRDGNGDVRICDISTEETSLLTKITEWDWVSVLFPDATNKEELVTRYAYVVKSIKRRVEPVKEDKPDEAESG
ncbi:hypothetical protein F5B20DRAFT_532067 [Whalleya microplaca]|nr:hypothetical protein F5B20DRAFT_532067 [Whalleya microplaca]